MLVTLKLENLEVAFDRAIELWHQDDSTFNLPGVELNLLALELAWRNFLLWHEEDKARRTDVDDSAIAMDESWERMIASCVGDIAAHAFVEHYNESVSLPYPWEVAQSPASARIPGSSIGQVQMVNNLVEYFFEAEENSRNGVLQYLNRMDGEMRELFAETLESKMGSTASDMALLKKVKQRLNIDFAKPTANPNPNP